MKHYRLHWDAVIGWIVDVDVALDACQLKKICDWAIPRQIDRWRSLPLGEKKTELEVAIKKLQAYKIQQRVVQDQSGTTTLFKSDQGTGKIISVGGI